MEWGRHRCSFEQDAEGHALTKRESGDSIQRVGRDGLYPSISERTEPRSPGRDEPDRLRRSSINYPARAKKRLKEFLCTKQNETGVPLLLPTRKRELQKEPTLTTFNGDAMHSRRPVQSGQIVPRIPSYHRIRIPFESPGAGQLQRRRLTETPKHPGTRHIRRDVIDAFSQTTTPKSAVRDPEARRDGERHGTCTGDYPS